MGFHQRKPKWNALGLPEWTAFGVLLLALTPVLLWWGTMLRPDWQVIPGQVLYCSLKELAYDRDPLPDEVALTYQYHVLGKMYIGHWQGFWPQRQSPNALPKSELKKLCQHRYPLQVFYDPAEPSRSTLHFSGSVQPITYRRLSLVAIAGTLFFLFRVYPSWKSRT